MKWPGIKIGLLIFFILPLVASGCLTPAHVYVGATYINPSWGPPYDRGVRYYYLPDVEAYYDLSAQEFVYLDNGMWIFSATLPPVYSYYDLNAGFIIALNWNVYQPWLYHQYYLSHYPRYYYRHYYYRSKTPVRGFNENDRKPIWRINTDGRINMPHSEGNSKVKNPRVENEKQKIPVIKKPQPSIYRGRTIGQPVRVFRDMREKKR